jgi:hypothetical protein
MELLASNRKLLTIVFEGREEEGNFGDDPHFAG